MAYTPKYNAVCAFSIDQLSRAASSDLLFMLDGIVGEVYDGYKGGRYAMHYLTPIWIVEKYYAEGRKLLSILPGGGLITCNEHKDRCEFDFFL